MLRKFLLGLVLTSLVVTPVSSQSRWVGAFGGVTSDSTDTFTNKTIDANGTGNSLTNVDVADLATGTDGELITWNSSGNPAVVAAGDAAQVLTSNGAGAAPTMQAVGGAVTGYTATLTDAVNTTSAVNVVTASVDDMGDGDVLEIWFASLVKNNKGSTVNGTFKFVWGSDTHTMLAALDWGNSATEGKQFGFVRCQRVGADLWIYDGAALTGTSHFVERKTWLANFGGSSMNSVVAVISGATFDSAQTVGIEIQFNAADATTYLKPLAAVVIKYDGNV